MTLASARAPRRLPVAAWPALAGLLLLAWAVHSGVQASSSRSTILLVLGFSLVLFGVAIWLDRRSLTAIVAPAAMLAGPKPVPLVAAPVPLQPAAASNSAKVPATALPALPVASTRAVVAPQAVVTSIPVLTAIPAVASTAAAASKELMNMTLGELLLGALRDDPEDTGRLLALAIGRAGHLSAAPATPATPVA